MILVNAFALTTVIDVNITSIQVPTLRETCQPSEKNNNTYFYFQQANLELTDNTGTFITGLSFGSTINVNGATKRFLSFERDLTKSYDLRISVLPKYGKAYQDKWAVWYGKVSVNSNCVPKYDTSLNDFLEANVCSYTVLGSGFSGACKYGVDGKWYYNLRVTRNCTTPRDEFGTYAYTQVLYTYTDYNFDSNTPIYPTILDPFYPQRFCIELGRVI